MATEAVPFKVPVLVSYAFLRKQRNMRAPLMDAVAAGKIELLLDSGAFTAKNLGEEISLDEYCGFLEEHKEHLHGYIALDVLQDPHGTEVNLKRMLERGLRPVPVHVFGDDEARMNELFGISPWVALGGLRRPHRGRAPLSYVKLKMQWAAGRDVHWLGYTVNETVRGFSPYSIDSASWASGAMWGRHEVYFGGGRWGFINGGSRVAFDPRLLDGRNTRWLARFGFDLNEMNEKKWWASNGKIGAASWIWYGADLRRICGTRVFLAVCTARHFLEILGSREAYLASGLHESGEML